MSKFIKFLGHSALAGKQVAVYENEGGFCVEAETIGGKPVLYSYTDDDGKKRTAAVQGMSLTAEQFEKFENSVTAGITGTSDARIVQRALVKMGYPAFDE